MQHGNFVKYVLGYILELGYTRRKEVYTMVPLTTATTMKINGNKGMGNKERDVLDALYQELEKGIQSMKMVRFIP